MSYFRPAFRPDALSGSTNVGTAATINATTAAVVNLDAGGDDNDDVDAKAALVACIGFARLGNLQNLRQEYLIYVAEAGPGTASADLGPGIALAAAQWGRLDCLRWATATVKTWDKAACASAAAEAGHVDCLRLLAALPCPLRGGARADEHWPREAWVKAASAGRRHCLAALAAMAGGERAAALAQEACPAAAEAGHLACVRFLAEEADPLHNGLNDAAAAAACTLAARAGRAECLEYLLRNYAMQVSPHAAAAAARGGHEDCLRLLHGHGCRSDQWAMEWAARMGHVHCMRFMHQAGFPWVKTDTCFVAAARGQLACLAYARAEGECPWDARVPAAAADAGSLSCLEYLRSAGCPWDAAACGRAAARSDHVDCLRFVCDEATVDERAAMLADAAKTARVWRSPGCLQLLRDRGGGGGDALLLDDDDDAEAAENEWARKCMDRFYGGAAAL